MPPTPPRKYGWWTGRKRKKKEIKSFILNPEGQAARHETDVFGLDKRDEVTP